MQMLTEEERERMLAKRPPRLPMRRCARDIWFAVLDAAVRALTFGRGRVVAQNRRIPMRWTESYGKTEKGERKCRK